MFKRKGATRVKNLDGIHKIMPHLMDKRCDAEVYMKESFDVTEILKYLDKINENLKEEEKISIFNAVITIVIKLFYNRPYLNRFISGRRLYQRNEISASFVIKKIFEDSSDEALYIYRAKEDDNLFSINKTVKDEVYKIRKSNNENIDKIINLITASPRFITMFIVKVLKILDFYGLLPESITKDDPNFTSVFLTNLGSIKAREVFHHLNNYGTNSLFISVGVIYEKDNRKYIDMGFTVDERIADGFYFAKSIILAKEVFKNPAILEESVSSKIKE